MTRFSDYPMPLQTSWGHTLAGEQILPGIWQIGTASHGGYVQSEERQAAMPEPLRLDTCEYEEDVDWSLVALGYEAELLGARLHGIDVTIRLAHDIARNWHPDRYAHFTGRTVEPRDSYVLRRRAAYQAMLGEIVVISASGDWADWVPQGKVGVIGQRVERVDHLGRPTYSGPRVRALVAKERYDSREILNSFAAIGAEPI